MSKRLNILLPETTPKTIELLTRPGEPRRFIDKAVRAYVSHQSTEALRSRLELTAVRDQDIDRQVAEDWVAVDHEASQQLDARLNIRRLVKPDPRRGSSPVD